MKYFYTGANSDGDVQTNSELSLGGHISSSPIPNDMLQNIFSEASYLSIQQNKRETKLIVLKNDSITKTATLLSLVLNANEDTLAKYKIAFVEPSDEGCFERIIDASALPFEATFNDVVFGEVISLPDIASSKYLGIWLTREYDFTSDDLKTKTCTDYKNQLDVVPVPEIVTKDTLSLVLDYTLV